MRREPESSETQPVSKAQRRKAGRQKRDRGSDEPEIPEDSQGPHDPETWDGFPICQPKEDNPTEIKEARPLPEEVSDDDGKDSGT
eukprot:14171015-Heterocapsa_arctica.AAC.1